jgi:membrane protein YqaA with SNARE-associated domain
MSLLLVTAVAFGSAVLPLISIEVFVLAMMSGNPGLPWLAVGAAAALGQMAGKTLYFLVSRAEIQLPSWMRKRTKVPAAPDGDLGEAPAGSLSRRLRTGYGKLRVKCRENPRWLLGTLAVSSLVGLPPIMLTTVLAGLSRMRLRCYLAVSLPGRLVRFAALAASPALVTGWTW